MNTHEEAAAVVAVLVTLKNRKNRKRRSTWVKPWLAERNSFCIYDNLLQELRSEDEKEYRKLLYMCPEVYYELLSLVEADITKSNTLKMLLRKKENIKNASKF